MEKEKSLAILDACISNLENSTLQQIEGMRAIYYEEVKKCKDIPDENIIEVFAANELQDILDRNTDVDEIKFQPQNVRFSYEKKRKNNYNRAWNQVIYVSTQNNKNIA